jgi:alpha/beta superfamily hydrolase
MQQHDVKQTFTQFGGYIATSTSVVVVAIALLLGGSATMAKQKVKETEQLNNKLQTALQRSSPQRQQIKNYNVMLQKNWQQNVKLEQAPGLEHFYERGKLDVTQPIPLAQQWINSPENLAVDVGMEKITVKWGNYSDLSAIE